MKSAVEEDKSFSPHFAGVPSQIIVKAIGELGVEVQIPFENFE